MSKEIVDLLLNFNPDNTNGCPMCGNYVYSDDEDNTNVKALANEIIKLASVELLKEQKYCSELLSRVVEAILNGGDAMSVSNETDRYYIQKKKINE
jgi:hypothetical protein